MASAPSVHLTRFCRAGLFMLLFGLARSAGAAGLLPGPEGWQRSGQQMVRGVTVGPIENALFPGRGYGSEPYLRTLRRVADMGANWISLTVFGRVFDRPATGVSLTFEAPFETNRQAVARAIEQAHAQGLKVLLVPHLWVESGSWRGDIDPGEDRGWLDWEQSYRRFLLEWAEVARAGQADMLAVGVELRSWVTTSHAPSFVRMVREVRRVYPGLLTYGGNWDDVQDTVILGELDLIGVNAFFPLATSSRGRLEQLVEAARAAARRLGELSYRWDKPVLFTEFGYTTRRDCAREPWLWPEQVRPEVIDERAQAEAYYALLSALLDQTWFAGFFVWRIFADLEDTTQEPAWGFSPLGKQAECVLRDAFAARWAADGPGMIDLPWIRGKSGC